MGSNKFYVRKLDRSRFGSLFEDNVHLNLRKGEVQWNKLMLVALEPLTCVLK